MTIKRNLFLFNQHRVRSNLKSGASFDDKFTQVFGNIIPRQIPESSAWWKAQNRDLEAICDDAETGDRPCASSTMLRAAHTRVM